MSMSHIPLGRGRRVLISGASIAGPTLAYWLDRYGFAVTVVERAPAVRSGGYPIDIRGTALGVVDRMGLRPAIDAAHIASRSLSFVDAEGRTVGAVPVYDLTANVAGRDVELPRGALTALLYGRTADGAVQYRFSDAIEAMDHDGDGVDVWFRSGARERYDIVIGADGLHSATRRLAFGPEASFSHHLGLTFNLFSMPNDLGLSHAAIVYAEPGRAAGVFAVKDSPDLGAFLIFATETPPFGAHADRDEQVERTASVFAGGGWQVPRMVEAMRRADDLYFDTVSQIRMPAWSKGRVALVGDAAYAPSFRSGQGTSLALVGAYVLAGELSARRDPAEAFVAYEGLMRPYVEANQALAGSKAASFLFPRTRAELDARDRELARMQSDGPGESAAGRIQPAHTLLSLPDYS